MHAELGAFSVPCPSFSCSLPLSWVLAHPPCCENDVSLPHPPPCTRRCDSCHGSKRRRASSPSSPLLFFWLNTALFLFVSILNVSPCGVLSSSHERCAVAWGRFTARMDASGCRRRSSFFSPSRVYGFCSHYSGLKRHAGCRVDDGVFHVSSSSTHAHAFCHISLGVVAFKRWKGRHARSCVCVWECQPPHATTER